MHRPIALVLLSMNLFMYSCITLISAHGENVVFASIDYVTQYLHLLTIVIQCISAQEGKFIVEPDEKDFDSYYDGDNHPLFNHG